MAISGVRPHATSAPAANTGATGSKIIELAKNARTCSFGRIRANRPLLLKTLESNSTFDCGSLSVAHVKPFDLLVEGNETEDWLVGTARGRDSNTGRATAR